VTPIDLPSISDRRVTVMGLGLFGGGVGVTRYLVDNGAQVTVTDLRDNHQLAESLEALGDLPVTLVLGEHRDQDFIDADLVVVNPAVVPHSEYLAMARGAGVKLTSEVVLFVAKCAAPVVGVTGSNGKTTTTGIIGAILKAHDPRTLVGGNIGGSLLSRLDEIRPDVPVVLELSSFQLTWLGEAGWSPQIAVVTNLTPNHLDWHGTLESYCDAKRQILAYQTSGDLAVLNAKDERVGRWDTQTKADVVWAGGTPGAAVVDGSIVVDGGGGPAEVLAVEYVPLLGPHNVENTLAAVAATSSLGVPIETIRQAIKSFEPIEHRLETVAIVKGVRYVNDSIATTPEATIMALRSFDAPIVLIAGGYDKKIEFNELGVEIAAKSKALIALGATAEKIARAARMEGMTEDSIHDVSSIESAVELASHLANSGDVALLSPACASYDQFRHFAERGEIFAASVLGLSDST